MKKVNLILITILALVSFSSCQGFLDKPSKTSFSDEVFWTSKDNVEAFAWGLYSMVPGFSDFNYSPGVTGMSTDLLANGKQNLTDITVANTGSMSYANIRKCNYMIDRLGTMENISEVDKNHYIGVAKFFRAWQYYNMIVSFGEVPLQLEYVDAADLDNIYLPRSPRADVANQVVADLEDAIAKLKANPGELQINQDIAKALLARFCLFEGTWQKYHNGATNNVYLTKAADYSGQLINGGKYALQTAEKDQMGGWRQRLASFDLTGNPEMILYKRYELARNPHSNQAYAVSNNNAGMTKMAADRYLCTDGLPIYQSPLYQGDATINAVRANRDSRFTDIFYPEGYGIEVVAPTVDGTGKIPVNSTGYTVRLVMNPTQNVETDPAMSGNQAGGITDAPVFMISEQYLIYAEAKAELGTLTQADLDNTINLLRARAGVAPLKVQGTDAYSGTDGNTKIVLSQKVIDLETATGYVPSGILYEIRRERMTELFYMSAVNHQDIFRWKKGGYLDASINPDTYLGANCLAQINDALASATDPTAIANLNKVKAKLTTDGYYAPYESTNVWNDKYYLLPIPQTQINLYEGHNYTLTQNPGW